MIKSPRLTSTSKKLCFLFLFLAFTICLGVGFSRAIIHSQDFVAPYTGARCLLDGCNPYDIFELNREYYAHGGVAQELPPWEQEIPVYPPSTLLLISPFALSSFPVARVIWAILNSCSLILAVALVRSVCPTAVPWLSTLLLCCFLVINYKMLLGLGQIALPAISFFVISAVLFLKNRQTALATVLLMVSIAMKPQIGGLMVMYFLLKKIHRRQTWLGLVGVLGLSVTAIFTLELRLGSHVWFESLRANVATSMRPGGLNDPRPIGGAALAGINLQSITSVIFSDGRTFNAVAYAISLLLLIGLIIGVRRANTANFHFQFLTLGALASISLLPLYHRAYDAGILLIAIPAVPFVFLRHRVVGVLMAISSILAIEPLQATLPRLLNHDLFGKLVQNQLLTIFVLREENLAVLVFSALCVTGIFLNVRPDRRDQHVA